MTANCAVCKTIPGLRRLGSAQPFTAGLEIDGITFGTGRLFPETVEVRGNAIHRHGRQICGLAPDRERVERL
jgi:hypothetical protein